MLLVLAAGLAYFLIGFNRGLSIYDEAIPVYGAARIVDGDVPYRDFWTIYPPGQFYLLAGVFRIFGPGLLVERLASIVLMFLTAVLLYVVSRRIVPARLAWLAAGLWGLAFGASTFFGSPVTSVLVLSAASWLLFLRWLDDPRVRWLAASGAVVGVAMLFRLDIALYTVASEAIFTVAGTLGEWAARRMLRACGLLRATGRIVIYGAAVALPVVAAVALLLLVIPGSDLIEDLVRFPLTGFRSARSLPFPALVPDAQPVLDGRISVPQYLMLLRDGLRFYFPVAVFALVCLMILIRRWKRRPDPFHEVRAVAFICVTGIFLLAYAATRSDIPHMAPAFMPALLLFAWLLSKMPATGWRRSVCVVLAATWSLVFVWGALVAKTDALARTLVSSDDRPLDLPRARGIVVGPDMRAAQAAIQYVRVVVPPGSRIFVGNAHHDSLVLNDVMFYFLADRHSATRYHELSPGVATTRNVQAEIVRDLERHRVQYAVLRTDPSYVPSGGRGADVLDQFLREKFIMIREFGQYRVWRRQA